MEKETAIKTVMLPVADLRKNKLNPKRMPKTMLETLRDYCAGEKT